MITYPDLIQFCTFIVALVGKSKLLDFPTNPNLGEIQTFYGEDYKSSFLP
ncbi:MAG: hypothetical protein Q4C65_05670 [Eubacteriales bacterium]|nr:hypothetical protein [Eubacteriales bacterium]